VPLSCAAFESERGRIHQCWDAGPHPRAFTVPWMKDHADVARLLADAGIVRSRAKIVATIGNARAYLAMQAAGEDFATFAWRHVGGKPIVGGARRPTQSPESEALSKALKARGFKFVGPVIVYAWMQAVGMVDDHDAACFRRVATARGSRRARQASRAR